MMREIEREMTLQAELGTVYLVSAETLSKSFPNSSELPDYFFLDPKFRDDPANSFTIKIRKSSTAQDLSKKLPSSLQLFKFRVLKSQIQAIKLKAE